MTSATRRYTKEQPAPDAWLKLALESRRRILEKYGKEKK